MNFENLKRDIIFQSIQSCVEELQIMFNLFGVVLIDLPIQVHANKSVLGWLSLMGGLEFRARFNQIRLEHPVFLVSLPS